MAAGVYHQISTLVKQIREIGDDLDDDVVFTLLEQLGALLTNQTFRSLLAESDVTLSLMKIFIARNEKSREISMIIAKCLTSLSFRSFNTKLKVVKSEEFMESMKTALKTADKRVVLQLVRLVKNLGYDENRLISLPLQPFVAILCDLLEKSFSKGWKRTLHVTLGALWNLSSHSTENKEAICGHNATVQLLISCLGDREIDLVKQATGVLYFISECFVTDFLTYKDVIETFDLIPQLISILIAVRSPDTVLNAIGILTNLINNAEYRNQICANENVFLRLLKLRYANNRTICKASANLLGKITCQDRSTKTVNTPVDASFAHVVTSTPRAANPRSRLNRSKKRPDSLTLLRSKSRERDSPKRPEMTDVMAMYTPIIKKSPKTSNQKLNRSYGEFEHSPCIEIMEHEVQKVTEGENADLTVANACVTHEYEYISVIEAPVQSPSPPKTKTKKSPLRFLSKLLKLRH